MPLGPPSAESFPKSDQKRRNRRNRAVQRPKNKRLRGRHIEPINPRHDPVTECRGKTPILNKCSFLKFALFTDEKQYSECKRKNSKQRKTTSLVRMCEFSRTINSELIRKKYCRVYGFERIFPSLSSIYLLKFSKENTIYIYKRVTDFYED